MNLLNWLKSKKDVNKEVQLLRSLYPNANISEHVELTKALLITIGRSSKINKGVNLLVYGEKDGMKAGKIQIGMNCLVSNDSKLFAGRGQIEIGNDVEIGMNCFVSAQRRVKSRKLKDTDDSIETLTTTIGDECMLASGCFIVEGATLGKRCIVAAGAVVSGQYGDDLLLVGNPARPIPQNKNMRT